MSSSRARGLTDASVSSSSISAVVPSSDLTRRSGFPERDGPAQRHLAAVELAREEPAHVTAERDPGIPRNRSSISIATDSDTAFLRVRRPAGSGRPPYRPARLSST